MTATDPTTGLYTSIPQTITATQWDGTVRCSSAIAVWSGGKTRLTDAYGLELLAGKDGAQEWVPVPVGHWLVRQPGDTSDIWPVDPAYFAAKYQPAVAERADSPALFEGTVEGVHHWPRGHERHDEVVVRGPEIGALRMGQRVRVVAIDQEADRA